MREKSLVVFFSASGATRLVALELGKRLNADIYEIKPLVPYSYSDLSWTNKKSRSSIEMNDPSSRPEIEGDIDISSYDTIYVGFPIWWYIEPRIILSFLDKHDLSRKTLIPFCTSGGSSIAKAENHLSSLYPTAKWGKGARISNVKELDELYK